MVSKTRTRKHTGDEEAEREDEYDEQEEPEEIEESVAQPVVSDSRARRKRKRGELIESPTEMDAATTEKKGRPTPSRRKASKAVTSRPVIQRIPVVRSLYNYLSAAITEMRKVTWPSREEATRLTRMVLAVTVSFSVGLGIFDLFYTWWFRQALDHDAIFLLVATIVLVIGGTFAWFVFIREDDYSPF